MATSTFHPAVPLGGTRAQVDGIEALTTRIRMVLETRPGQVPWRPDFGCDLEALVGKPATPHRLVQAQWKVEESLRRWIPEVDLVHCRVRPIMSENAGALRGSRDLPLGESSLVNFGVQVALEIEVDLQTDAGQLVVQAVVEP